MTTTTKTPEVDEHARSGAPDDSMPVAGADSKRVQLTIIVGIALVLALVIGLYLRAASKTNHVSLAEAPKPVTVEKAMAASYRPTRTYVGTTMSWNAARVGPQYVSAYVGSVLVRPGAIVRRGEVLATLDCRNASAASREIAAKARALEDRQAAAEHEAARTKEMQQGGFASENELEQLSARSSAEKAEVESLRASMVSRTLEVDDCIMRAPFAGEVSDRFVDPGAYLRPGNPVVTVIDRSQVRITADAPESDFDVVAPGTPVNIQVEATGAKTKATVSRRAPAADEVTRTVHFEIDVANANHLLPVGTTANLTIDVGKPQQATRVPLRAATLRGEQAAIFTVTGGVAKRATVPVLGEGGGMLFLDPKLAPGSLVVVEGRALLDDGDQVSAKELAP